LSDRIKPRDQSSYPEGTLPSLHDAFGDVDVDLQQFTAGGNGVWHQRKQRPIVTCCWLQPPEKVARWKSSCQAEMKRIVKTLPVVWSAAPCYTNMGLPYFQRNPHPASDFLIVSMEINFGIEQDLPTQKLCDITHLQMG
jgi:hypothetical protein